MEAGLAQKKGKRIEWLVWVKGHGRAVEKLPGTTSVVLFLQN
jgi:hypothetical protein